MAYYPGRKVEHKNPSRISLSKILIVVALVAVVYVALTLFPPWWRYYRSSSVMADETQKAFSQRRAHHSWAQIQSSIHAHVRAELLEVLKIPEKDLHLVVDKKENDIHVTASWKAVARWPLIGKTTTMRFKEEVNITTR